MHRRRRRNSHLRRLFGLRCNEPEMLDHRMAGEIAELARHTNQKLLRLHATLECDFALTDYRLDARQRRNEVGLPGSPAIFSVGDGLEPYCFLLLDQKLDLAI